MSADVASSLKNWSASEGSNAPAGSVAISSNLDDNLRMLQAVVRQDLASKGSDIASAGTTDLGAVAGLYHDITGSTTVTGLGTVSEGIWKIVQFDSTPQLSNSTAFPVPTSSNVTAEAGDHLIAVSLGSGNWRIPLYQRKSGLPLNGDFPDSFFRVVGSSDATKKVALEVDGLSTATTRTATYPDYNIRHGNLPAGIGPIPYSGSSIPTGWLECDGSAVSRSTYSALFTAIGTTWGSGDGSTTFNLPDFRNRSPIGAGTGAVTEDVTASSSNGFTVAANDTKWITGMAVVLSNLSGFTTSATAGPTYYAVRISSTNVRLATTLALAQNASPDVTISGSGTATLTHTFTARTLGQYGGEESHAMSITELLAHTHGAGNQINISASGATLVRQTDTSTLTVTGSTGGNAAMNNMQPFGVVKFIISY